MLKFHRFCGRLIFLFLFIFSFSSSLTAKKLYLESIEAAGRSPNSLILGICKDTTGFLWVGSTDGLYRYNGYDFQYFDHYLRNDSLLQLGRIRDIYKDTNGFLWVYTFADGYLRLDYEKEVFIFIPIRAIPGAVINHFSQSQSRISNPDTINGIKYYISEHKLNGINIYTKEAVTYISSSDHSGNLNDNYVTSFYVDDHDLIWLGTQNGMIYRVNTNQQAFLYYSSICIQGDKKLNASVKAIYKFKNEYWLASVNNGISIYSNGKFLSEHSYYRFTNRQSQVRSMLAFDDKLWIGGVSGLDVYDPQRQQLIQVINKSLFSDFKPVSVYALHQFGNNVIAGIFNRLIIFSRDFKIKQQFDLSKQIGKHSIIDIEIDKEGKIWISTEGGGLLSIQLDKDFHLLRTEQFLEDKIGSNVIYDSFITRSGDLYIGNSTGLLHIDTKSNEIRYCDFSPSLYNHSVYSIQGDKKGNIWIAYLSGISKISDKKNEKQYTIPTLNANQWSFQLGGSYYDRENNELFFGAKRGFVSFDPDKVVPNRIAPIIRFKSLVVDGNTVDVNERLNGEIILRRHLNFVSNITLSRRNNNITLNIQPIYLQYAARIRYYFRIQDRPNSKWMISDNPQLNFNELNPGKYKLEVRAQTEDEIWSNTLVLPIIVKQVWYLSYIAIVFYFCLICLISYLIARDLRAKQRLKNQIELERLHSEQVEILNKERIDFFTNISHELRTPLSLIKDPLRQLKSEMTNKKHWTYYLDLIDKNVIHLSSLTNQILDFRKAEAKKLKRRNQEVEIVGLLEKVIESFKLKALERHIQLTVNFERSRFVTATDEEKFRSIITNVLSNALKYTPDNGFIQTTLNYSEKQLIVLVVDNGVGIAENELKNIFDPFNNSGSQPFYGESSGMGLALTKKYVEFLNGEIAITSEEGKGTTVTIKMPFDEIKEALVCKSEEPEDEGNGKPLLLIVEDNSDIRNYLANELKDIYLIEVVSNGKEGLKKAVTLMPDIILSDVMMSEMDGLEMTSKLKLNERTNHIPVVMLTAKTTDTAILDGLTAGADAYYTKPFNLEILKVQLNNILVKRAKFHEFISENKIKESLAENATNSDEITNAFLMKVVRLVEDNIDLPGYKQESLADELCISTRQLSRKIKAVSGMTPLALITKIKMEQADNLLRNSNKTVSEIAYCLGYTEPSNFTRAFTKHYGTSPTKFRE